MDKPEFVPSNMPDICEDCPPTLYPTDKTRCDDCPRVSAQPAAEPVDVREALADMIGAAYHAGATDVHRAWVEGNGQSEADFGEAASDYIAHVEPQFAAIVYREGPRHAE